MNRERERERDRQRDRETDRQTDRDRDSLFVNDTSMNEYGVYT